MNHLGGKFPRRGFFVLLAVWFPLGAGCTSMCLSEAGWVCGPEADFGGQYSVHAVSRNDKADLVLYAKLPTVESNRTALLVTHISSEDTDASARYAVMQWGSVFSGQGYTVVAHAYSEADSAYGQFDLQDTLDAVDWLNGAGAAELGVDRVFLQGTSRGGIIAYQAAYRVDPEKLAGVIADRGVSNFLLMQEGYEVAAGGGFGSAIQRAVQLTLDWVGGLPAEDPEPWMELSAGYQIDRIGVPMLVIHGDSDFLVPFEQAADFRARVQEAGRSDIEFYLVPGRGHFDLGFDPDYREVVLDFMRRH